MKLTLSSVDDLSARVEEARAEYERRHPGRPDERRPVHTLYVPADRFTATTPADLGKEALRLLETHVTDAAAAASAFGIDTTLAETVHERVAAKLAREPVEDLRIDFEDGYGVRDDAEEDGHVAAAVEAVAQAYETRSLPYYWGLRVKSFADGGHRRAMRTLDGFLTGLAERLGRLPGGFLVTFPKIVTPDHVRIFVDFLSRFEAEIGLPEGLLRMEVQIETPQSVAHLPEVVAAAGNRLVAAQFGVYDYTAACGLPPSEQRLDHPACDHARHVLQVTLAGTGVRLVDGATKIAPSSDKTKDVYKAWRLHSGLVRYSLMNGFPQSCDLHVAQLPSRYAAVYASLLNGLDDAVDRLRADRAGQADGAFGDPGTAAALTARLRHAADCGAVDRDDIRDLIG
ncbi:aldolase/citrate lyase family protein [Actinoallomurus spadix]|uniref:Aldolase/citrate lyase family protein n=1 Tax=Actinoallomurus spadix TaxID=79912 RepID=A0ABN0W4G9_9ACTN|nr:aldolase/citrate lyase family protein [Actinoallomurus spadix]MCO5985576.1 aldolase/citrate lyase family protein [Actinoallomurus spadix]